MPEGTQRDPLYVSANPALEVAVKDFLGMNKAFFEDFKDEIQSLRESMNALAGSAAEQVKSMQKAMPSEVSAMASHAARPGVLGPSGEPLAPPPVQPPRDEERPKQPPLAGTDEEDYKHLPQFYGGQFTIQDAFDMFGKVLQNSATKPGGPGTIANLFGGEGAAQTGQFLEQKVAGQAIPRGYAAAQYMGQISQMVSGYTEYGESLGVPRGEGATEIGPLRIHSPAFTKGVTTSLSDWWTGAMTPGLSREQVAMVRGNLAELGWYGEDYQTQNMNEWGRNITQYSARLGENPMTYQLMDKAVRHGSASLAEMNKVIKQIPDVAEGARISWENLMETMDEFGQFSMTTGGTHATGQQVAQAYAGMTDIDPSALMPLQQSPITQGMMVMHGGVAPWATGTLSPELQASMGMRAFNMVAGATEGIPGGDPYTFKGFGGLTERNPAIEQQAATMSMMIPGLDPAVAERLLRSPKKREGITAGFEATGATRAWAEQVGTAQRQWEANQSPENTSKFLNSMKNSRKVGKGLRTAINPTTGQPMFEDDEIAEALAPFKGGPLGFTSWLDDDSNQRIRNDLTGAAMASGKFSDEAIEELEGDTQINLLKFTPKEIKALKGMSASDRAEAVRGNVDELWKEKMGMEDSEEGEGKNIVELGPNAARYFQLMSPQDVAKNYANSGSGVTSNSAYGRTTPTQPVPYGG